MLERAGRLPDVVVACVGGGSNAIGMLHPFVEDEGVRLVGVEAGGTGEPGCYNSAPINLGSPGVLHGHVTMLLQDKDGQIQPSHSISAGAGLPPAWGRSTPTWRKSAGCITASSVTPPR